LKNDRKPISEPKKQTKPTKANKSEAPSKLHPVPNNNAVKKVANSNQNKVTKK
jgi:hypothetical protein